MRIVFKDTFVIRLENQLEYISRDSTKQARKFKSDLLARIKEISSNPYRYRKSIYFDEESVRDLIFKGYVIVFHLTEKQIEVFGFVKYQKYPTDKE